MEVRWEGIVIHVLSIFKPLYSICFTLLLLLYCLLLSILFFVYVTPTEKQRDSNIESLQSLRMIGSSMREKEEPRMWALREE